MKTPNCRTPTSNPWNEGLKPSDSHIQPMEQRLQTIQLSCPTHGTKASNHPTLTYNPWNKGFKPSNSHDQPMEQRPQTIRLPRTTHRTNTSKPRTIPMLSRLQTDLLSHTNQ